MCRHSDIPTLHLRFTITTSSLSQNQTSFDKARCPRTQLIISLTISSAPPAASRVANPAGPGRKAPGGKHATRAPCPLLLCFRGIAVRMQNQPLLLKAAETRKTQVLQFISSSLHVTASKHCHGSSGMFKPWTKDMVVVTECFPLFSLANFVLAGWCRLARKWSSTHDPTSSILQ